MVEYAGTFVIAALMLAGILVVGPASMGIIFEAMLGSVQDHFSAQDG